MKDQLKLFSERLTALMVVKDFNQVGLAKVTGISSQTISCYCRGEVEPKMMHLVRLADVLDCTIDYLAGRTNDYAK